MGQKIPKLNINKEKKSTELNKNKKDVILKADKDLEKNEYKSKKIETLNETEFSFFNHHSGLSEEDLIFIYEKFHILSTNDRMDQETFRKLYCDIRPEPSEQVYKISAHVFRCFDSNKDGKISFNEFLMNYILTTKG
jgi:Ca2+-binding EF-hand superfamily protein